MKQFADKLLAGLIATCVLAGVPNQALSQPAADYPTKPVRIINISSPGGGFDVVARLIAEPLTRSLGQPVIVENRAGAGGNIASEYVAKSPPDGYTLLVTGNNHVINPYIYKNTGYDPMKDFAAVVELASGPSVFATGARSPYRSLKDVLNAARSQPGKLVYGAGGSGTSTHFAVEMLKSFANIDLVFVPYKEISQLHQDVIGGQIPFGMLALPVALPQIQSGLLHALAMTSETRWPTLPAVPTIAESGYPKFSYMSWVGILAPSGTPSPIIARLNREIAKVLANPVIQERLAALGRLPVGKSPAEFEAMLRALHEATGKLVSQIGIKAE